MNIKPTHIFSTLLAAVALSSFAGTASANTCKDIETFGLANRPAIEEALAKHYVSRANVILNGEVRVQNVSGCRARVKVPAGINHLVGRNPDIKTLKLEKGSMEMFVHIDPAQGNKMCITKTDLQKVQFDQHGPVEEKLFVRRHDDKNFFSGCLFD